MVRRIQAIELLKFAKVDCIEGAVRYFTRGVVKPMAFKKNTSPKTSPTKP